jgi:hypothetical protein
MRHTDEYGTVEWRRWRRKQFVRTLAAPAAMLILLLLLGWAGIALI